jgi:hypothetical protein
MHYYLPPRLQLGGHPPGNILAYYVPDAGDGALFGALTIKLDECTTLPCKTGALTGLPVWSPDARWTILIAPGTEGSQMLYLGDTDGEIIAEIGPGQSPAWLDAGRFVYVIPNAETETVADRLGRRFGQEVILVHVGQDTVTQDSLFFDAEMVRAAMPLATRPANLGLWTVQSAAPGSRWWYVTARGERAGEEMDYVMAYDPAAGEIGLVAPMGEQALVQSPIVSQSGGQAVVIGLSEDGSRVSVELIDADGGEIRPLASHVPQDWSADGQWLIQTDEETLTLVSTTSQVQLPIEHGLSGCYWAVWTQPQGDS